MHDRPERLARALPVLAVLAATTLVAGQLLAWVGIERAANAANRGEAEILLNALQAYLARDGERPGQEDLESFLAIHHEAGVRYVAIDDPHGLLEAGESRLTAPENPGGVRSARGRLRMRRGPLDHPPPHLPPPFPPPHGHPGARPGDIPPRPPGARPAPTLIIELEPQLGAALQADALRTLVAASMSALLFLALGFALRRTLREREEARLAAARDRQLAALGEMSGVLAHEIRNPLASLKGHAQLLVELLDDEKRKRKAERVVCEAFRLEEISDNLLEFVRSGELERAEHALELIAQEAIEATDLRGANVTLRGNALAEVDAPRLRQVLVNVLDNAAQVAEGEGIDLTITSEGHHHLIEIRDRGPGVPEGEEESIFAPFKTTRTRGTGLGLAIARRIVTGHGGQIRARNHPDGGAIFSIRLPRSES